MRHIGLAANVKIHHRPATTRRDGEAPRSCLCLSREKWGWPCMTSHQLGGPGGLHLGGRPRAGRQRAPARRWPPHQAVPRRAGAVIALASPTQCDGPRSCCCPELWPVPEPAAHPRHPRPPSGQHCACPVRHPLCRIVAGARQPRPGPCYLQAPSLRPHLAHRVLCRCQHGHHQRQPAADGGAPDRWAVCGPGAAAVRPAACSRRPTTRLPGPRPRRTRPSPRSARSRRSTWCPASARCWRS